MLEALKVIILGIVEGITEWLPISSTGHLILVEEFIHLELSESFVEMFNIVIQFGAILAVIIIYFHKLNPFAKSKTQKQQMLTIRLWVKVAIATIPAMICGLLFDDYVDEHFINAYVVAAMLIVYGVLYIVVEKKKCTQNSCGNEADTAYGSDGSGDRRFSSIGDHSGNIPVGRNDSRRIADRGVQRSCGRIYVFSCNSGYVWLECAEDA